MRRISLIDIDAERLTYAKNAVDRIMQVGNYPAKVEATTDRSGGLKDADIVIITILVHGPDGVPGGDRDPDEVRDRLQRGR